MFDLCRGCAKLLGKEGETKMTTEQTETNIERLRADTVHRLLGLAIDGRLTWREARDFADQYNELSNNVIKQRGSRND